MAACHPLEPFDGFDCPPHGHYKAGAPCGRLASPRSPSRVEAPLERDPRARSPQVSMTTGVR